MRFSGLSMQEVESSSMVLVARELNLVTATPGSSFFYPFILWVRGLSAQFK